MDLQSIFYLVSIVFIVTWFLVILVLLIGAMIGVRSFRRISQSIEEKLENNTISLAISLIPAIPLLLSELKKFVDKKKAA